MSILYTVQYHMYHSTDLELACREDTARFARIGPCRWRPMFDVCRIVPVVHCTHCDDILVRNSKEGSVPVLRTVGRVYHNSTTSSRCVVGMDCDELLNNDDE